MTKRPSVGSFKNLTERRECDAVGKARWNDMHSRERYLERVREEHRKADKKTKTQLLNEARYSERGSTVRF